jgi:hypothetical protein
MMGVFGALPTQRLSLPSLFAHLCQHRIKRGEHGLISRVTVLFSASGSGAVSVRASTVSDIRLVTTLDGGPPSWAVMTTNVFREVTTRTRGCQGTINEPTIHAAAEIRTRLLVV